MGVICGSLFDDRLCESTAADHIHVDRHVYPIPILPKVPLLWDVGGSKRVGGVRCVTLLNRSLVVLVTSCCGGELSFRRLPFLFR